MNLLIRELEMKDSPQVTELKKDFCLLMDTFEHGIKGYSDGYYDDDLYKKSKFYSSSKEPIYIAEYNDKIVGFIDIIFESDYLEIGDYTEIILSIYVEKDYRKYNIGKVLIDKAMEIAKDNNADFVLASVMDGNDGAVNFFTSLGFEKNHRNNFVKNSKQKRI